jgi:hypothetical protein
VPAFGPRDCSPIADPKCENRTTRNAGSSAQYFVSRWAVRRYLGRPRTSLGGMPDEHDYDEGRDGDLLQGLG